MYFHIFTACDCNVIHSGLIDSAGMLWLIALYVFIGILSIQERENTNFISTLSRRASLRNRNFINHDTAPSNPSVVPHIGQSFNLDELGDDGDDEGGLISAAPPGYLEVTGGEIPGYVAYIFSIISNSCTCCKQGRGDCDL